MAAPDTSFKQTSENLSLPELFAKFPDDTTAEKWFIKWRWPNGIRCAHCESERVRETPSHPSMPFYCNGCRRYFSAKTKSVLHNSKLGYQRWAIAIYLLAINPKGVSSHQLSKFLGITQKSAWHMAHRIREAWNDGEEQFDGPAEVDETYVGGKEGRKHANKRLRAGRGTVGKTPVVGIRDRATGRIDLLVVKTANKPTLQGFVTRRTARNTVIYTDDAAAYHGLPRPHLSVSHSAGEYVWNDVHTNSIESVWAMLKRGIMGVYHHLSVKHLHRYAVEFKGRHNSRPLNTLGRMALVVQGGAGKRLRYCDLTGPPVGTQPMLL